MVFDRSDLRVLRSAYEQALKALRPSKLLTEDDREHLARIVFDIGWARNRRGSSLRGAEALIASEAVAFVREETTTLTRVAA